MSSSKTKSSATVRSRRDSNKSGSTTSKAPNRSAPARPGAASSSPDAGAKDEREETIATRALDELSRFTFTQKQWRYLEELQAQADIGQFITQRETAKRVGCTPTTVSMWIRRADFRSASSKIIRSTNEPLIELLHRAVIRRGIIGSFKHAELAFRVAGRLRDLEGENDAPGVVAQASVTFVGLPQPPNAAQRARLNPPPGSSLVLNAEGVLVEG